MVKGEDAVRRKKNKLNRKKERRKESSSSSVSNRVAAIIASKKRRKSGKRRNCEGMCFSLPTVKDPFNDSHGKMDINIKETHKVFTPKENRRVAIKGSGVVSKKGTSGRDHESSENQQQQKAKVKSLGNQQIISPASTDKSVQKNSSRNAKVKLIGERGSDAHQGQPSEHSGSPSKFLIMCLNSIENALRHDGFFSTEKDKPLFAAKWGVEFWKYYSAGKDILETGGACATIEQLAWIASSAADSIARKEKEGLSLTSNFLLFIVPSQDKATKVRSMCKPLKAHGIHTVSLHPGASIDHQIHGLKSCEPEFLVSTPERLLELVSLKAIDISGVSLLVVDGLQTLVKDGYFDVITSIRQYISTNPQMMVFSDFLSYGSTTMVQNLLRGSICRLSFNDSVSSQGACIIQSTHVCASEEEKLSKGILVLDSMCADQLNMQFPKVLFVVRKDSHLHQLVAAIKSKGYFVSLNSSSSQVKNRESRPAVFIVNVESVATMDLGEFEVVIVTDIVHSIDDYVGILTRMARFSARGVLHSFLTAADGILSGSLIGILEKCGQAVPKALRNLVTFGG